MLRNFICAAAVVTLPAFAAAETITIETYTGPVEVAKAPETIAVFDFAVLDTLEALGVEADGIVGPSLLDYLDDATEGVTSVGTLFEPDFEATAALGPDLIIAGGRSSRVVGDLAKVAPTIDMTIWEDVVGQGLDRLDAYGAIFGKEAEAAALRADFEAKLAETAAALVGQNNALIVMTNGPKVSAYGAAGRFGWLHTALDLPEAIVDVEASTHGEAVSFEFIRDANPDVLFVIDRQAAIGQEGEAASITLDNALVRETQAWQNGKVVYLSSAPIYIAGGGIQSMTLILHEIRAAFAGN